MRVTVVGAGIMGLCTAWALSRKGHKVTIVERGPVPNPLGSSVDQHRLIRHPYGDKAAYTAMVTDAYAAWERLWEDLDERLYVETGTLAVGASDQPWLADSAATLGDQGIATEQLTVADIGRRFPLLKTDGLDGGFWMPTGGVLLAGRIVELLAHHLAGQGVSIWPRLAAKDIDPDSGSVDLDDGRLLEADKLVVAAGPWTTRLLPDLADRVTPSRQIVVYLRPPPDLTEAWSSMPMVLDIDPSGGVYLVPPVAGTAMKIGDHSFTLTGDADRDRDVETEEAEAIYALAGARLADFDRFRLDSASACFYTVEPEERFVLEPIGALAWVMTGFSGHGFKFAPLLGEAMAEALQENQPASDVTRWAAGVD